MMKNRILIIKEHQFQLVSEILENHRVPFTEGDYTEKITTTTMNRENKKTARIKHTNMLKFAQQLGCDNIVAAISLCGSGGEFNRRFKKEFKG